ncbi:DUF7736 domain-containing protein [Blautia pseudococcoides]
MAYTGINMGFMDEYYEYVGNLMGHPVM